MKSEYKKFKDTLSRSGTGRGKVPKIFQIMDVFLGDRPETEGLQNSIDTSGDAACSSAGAEISETASVDGLGMLFWQTIRKAIGGGGERGKFSSSRNIFFRPSPWAEFFSRNFKGIFV
jgi:hypothetical protein